MHFFLNLISFLVYILLVILLEVKTFILDNSSHKNVTQYFYIFCLLPSLEPPRCLSGAHLMYAHQVG